IVVLSGKGYTRLGNTPEMSQRVDWETDAMFSPPLNTYHQHVNADPEKPARLLGVTSAPLVMSSFVNSDFVFNTQFQFTDRFQDDTPFLFERKYLGNRIWRTNLVENLKTSDVEAWEERGKGSASLFWEMSDNVMMQPHISDIPVGTYKLGHRHKHEALIYIVSGQGYSLLTPYKGAERVKVDWAEGDIFAIPLFWYHQHFNVGESPARYLAIHNPPWMRRFNLEWRDQIEAEDEDPAIRTQYEEELAKARAQRPSSE
ncbi:MAG: cupin domain-containing protein, partial [Nitrospiraceae bacterium]